MPNDEEMATAIHKTNGRMQAMELEHTKVNMETRNLLGLLQADVKYIRESLQTMVTKTEFAPIKLLVYGFTGMVLSGAVGAILSLVYISRVGS